MRRRKLTFEVITKSILAFSFGALVGLGSYHLTGLFHARAAFAATEDAPTLEFPKTVSDTPAESFAQKSKLYKPSGPSSPSLAWYYFESPQPEPEEGIEKEPEEEKGGEANVLSSEGAEAAAEH